MELPPIYGRSALEPAITLGVNNDADNEDPPDFLPTLSVASSEEMRLLANLINDTGDNWDEFEALFSVTPFTSIPLPEVIEKSLPDEIGCRDCINAFVDHVVIKANKNESLETIDLEFEAQGDRASWVPKSSNKFRGAGC